MFIRYNNIFLSIHNKTINFISEALITAEKPIFSLKVPEEMSYQKFGDLAEGSTIWVFKDSQALLELSEEFHLGITDQLLEFDHDPHFQLLSRNSKIPIPLLLYQYSMNVCSTIKEPTVEKPREAVESIVTMTVPEVAKYLQLSDRTVRELVARQEIPFKRVGKSIRFIRETLLIWLNGGEVSMNQSGNKT